MRVVVEKAGISFGERRVFSGLSATFEASEVTALVGPSGSGKSTLLATLAGFRKLSQGSVWHENNGVRRRPHPRSVTWIAQESNILGARSALDNVLLGPLSEGMPLSRAVDLAMAALADVGLAHHVVSVSRKLSGGEKQRVAVARALASSRPIVLADEPSAGLDEGDTRSLAELFSTVGSRATIIVATHDPLMIAAADSVVSIRNRCA